MLFRGVNVVEVGGGLISLILPSASLRSFSRLISSIQSDTWWTVASRDNLRVLYSGAFSHYFVTLGYGFFFLGRVIFP